MVTYLIFIHQSLFKAYNLSLKFTFQIGALKITREVFKYWFDLVIMFTLIPSHLLW